MFPYRVQIRMRRRATLARADEALLPESYSPKFLEKKNSRMFAVASAADPVGA